MKFHIGACWITNKDLPDEDRTCFIDASIDPSRYPAEIASPGALRSARSGTQTLGQILNWGIAMRYNQSLPSEVLAKIKPEYTTQEIDCSSEYPDFKNCFLLITVDNI